MAEVFKLWEVIAQNIKVDNDKSYVETYLRSCQADAVARSKSFKHIGHER